MARTNSPSGNSLNASMTGRAISSDAWKCPFSASPRARPNRAVGFIGSSSRARRNNRDRQLRLSLGDAHFRQRQVRADQAGLQANRFLEQAGALIEPLLLKSDGAQHGMGGAARLRVRQRELCLRLGLFEVALLHEVRRALQRLAAVAGGRRP